MKDLKIIFVDSIKEKLRYPMYELKKDDLGFYKISGVDNLLSDPSMLCYRITMENTILESIYPDKVITMKQVVENLFQFQEKEVSKHNVKTLKNKHI